MSAPPLTVLDVPPEEAAEIRARVRAADPAALGPGRVLAEASHVAGLIALFSDAAVSDPIYDLPRPFTPERVGAWVAEAQAARGRGEAMLTVMLDAEGRVGGYAYVTVWPERSAAELAGATRADLQGGGRGGTGAIRTFDFIFEALGVRLIGLTAALDNVRSARLIDAAGFDRKGERESRRVDGTIRRSLYWELERGRWRALRRGGSPLA